MTPKVKETLKKLHTDFPYYAEKCLKIRAKQAVDGKKVVPFKLNKAQIYIHTALEAQKEAHGYVRALLLKGRQQGCSTYVGGRYFHKTSQRKGVKTFILTHMEDATNNLFGMVQRFHKNIPVHVKPSTSFSNRRELVFDKLDSAYGLGTAGSGDTGRSDTIDFLHGSEVAFWTNTDKIATGALQAAEKAEEIILESTANGMGNMFHSMWQAASSGRGKYIAIFVPWYWQEEYREPVPEGFELDSDEQKYFDAYWRNGLVSLEQMVWRRNKIIELKNPVLFKQEYPATASEAFQMTGHDPLIAPDIVMQNRSGRAEPYGPYIVGCDPAREGDDATTFIRRQGRKAWRLESHLHLDDMDKAGRAKKILDSEPVTMMFIDRGGGSGMYDRLAEMGYGDRVKLVNFGSKALDDKDYSNRRAEMWGTMKEWMESEMETEIPDDDGLQSDIVAPGYKYTSTTQLQLEPKKDIKKRIGKSPDGGDALALTFAEPVAVKKQRIVHVGYGPLDAAVGY